MGSCFSGCRRKQRKQQKLKKQHETNKSTEEEMVEVIEEQPDTVENLKTLKNITDKTYDEVYNKSAITPEQFNQLCINYITKQIDKLTDNQLIGNIRIEKIEILVNHPTVTQKNNVTRIDYKTVGEYLDKYVDNLIYCSLTAHDPNFERSLNQPIPLYELLIKQTFIRGGLYIKNGGEYVQEPLVTIGSNLVEDDIQGNIVILEIMSTNTRYVVKHSKI